MRLKMNFVYSACGNAKIGKSDEGSLPGFGRGGKTERGVPVVFFEKSLTAT